MKPMLVFVLTAMMLAVLGGLVSVSSPTTAFVANIPPQWDYPTSEFSGSVDIDLADAFFDPDGDPLAFSVAPGQGVFASVQGDRLSASGVGTAVVSASDGKAVVSKRITLE